jgi:soluble lytic murein transglycosylase-like protein
MIEEAEPVEMPPTATTDPIPVINDTDPIPVVRERTTAHIPMVLLSGPDATSTTSQLAALISKSPTTGKHPSLTSALQSTMTVPTSATARLVVIHAGRKRKKAHASARRLNPRLRQTVVLIMTLAIFIGTLASLVPLSDNANGNIFSNLGSWIRSAQMDWQIQAHQGSQGNSTAPTSLNGPGLPYMPIANSPYVVVAEQAANDAGIPPVYFVRQIQQESGFNPGAVSVTNAEGIAQFEPYTASGLGINPWDPNQALRGAARLMANYYRQYGNYAKALGAYNAGPGAVQGATYACGMNWLSCMPGQSQDYVYRIMGV